MFMNFKDMKGEKNKGYVDLCFVDMDMYINRFKFMWFNIL